MGTALHGLALVFVLASLVCHIIVLIDAFRNEVWKGIVGLICGLYLLVYAFTDYQSENKTIVILVWLLGGVIGASLSAMSGRM